MHLHAHDAGAEMPSWYDLQGLSARTAEPCTGIEATRSMLDHMIGMEIEAGISERRIVLGGFSQGGASAIYTGIRQQHGLAGLFPIIHISKLITPYIRSNPALPPTSGESRPPSCPQLDLQVIPPDYQNARNSKMDMKIPTRFQGGCTCGVRGVIYMKNWRFAARLRQRH